MWSELESLPALDLRYVDTDFPDVKDPMTKLIRLARFLDANIITSDMNRIQQSFHEGVSIINIHMLSNALKPITQTGEHINIKIQRYGKEPRQGVGYLEDGTMVVVNGGAEYIGETIKAQVLSVETHHIRQDDILIPLRRPSSLIRSLRSPSPTATPLNGITSQYNMIGIGNDIIEIDRVRKCIERYGQRFLDRVFTVKEQNYCLSRKDPPIHFAGRFAAKEAIVKALGTGFTDSVTWLDIEIVNGDGGKPRVVLSEKLQRAFDNPSLQISISHCRSYATAVAISI